MFCNSNVYGVRSALGHPRNSFVRLFWSRTARQRRAQRPGTEQRYRWPGSKHILVVSSGILSLVLFDVFQPVPISTNRSIATDTGYKAAKHIEFESTLARYRISEVREHGPKSKRPWISYGNKIYDITEWVAAHLGGEVILRAAGGSIEPYWDIFSIHKTQYVRDILEQYVVGQLHEDDLVDGLAALDQILDPFSSDPERDPRMQILTQKPCNAETPGDELADTFLTPNETFYIRNHMWVPLVEEAEADKHEISIETPNGDSKTYTVGYLKSHFKQYAVTSVLQCSGNRRKDMTEHAKKTNGLQWTVGAISCAKWEGVRLRDVLADAARISGMCSSRRWRHTVPAYPSPPLSTPVATYCWPSR